MTKTDLPPEYEPFHEQVVCSNLLEGGRVPISIDGHAVFLLGRGEQVNVWLQVPTGEEWNYELTPEGSDDSAYSLTRSGEEVSVHFGPHLILHAERTSEERVEIDHLDFSSFGLAIYGSAAALRVGTSQLVNNRYIGVETMVAIR